MFKKTVLAVVVALIAYRAADYIAVMGTFKTVYNHSPGPCRTVQGIEHGSEDMAYIPGDKVLITSGLRFVHRESQVYANRQAAVYVFDFNKPNEKPQSVTFKNFKRNIKDCDFHGLSVWIDGKTDEIRVFVVNHLVSESLVEIFTYDDKKNVLLHKESVGSGDPNFMLLNDVVGVGPRQFYVTNYQKMRRGSIEATLLLKLGFITYFDGKTSHVATNERFLMANGIERSLDGKYIYMAHISGREIISYKRNADNSLTLIERFPTYTLPDNLIMDPQTGDLWTGCHSVGKAAMEYLGDPSKLSPSQVLRLRVSDGHVTDMYEVFSDDGKKISGSSVAIYGKGQLLIGTVASTTLHCDVKYLP